MLWGFYPPSPPNFAHLRDGLKSASNMRCMVSEAGVSDVAMTGNILYKEVSHSNVRLYSLTLKIWQICCTPLFPNLLFDWCSEYCSPGCCYIVPLAFALEVHVNNNVCQGKINSDFYLKTSVHRYQCHHIGWWSWERGWWWEDRNEKKTQLRAMHFGLMLSVLKVQQHQCNSARCSWCNSISAW